MAVINPPGFLHNLSTHTAQVDRISNIAGQLAPAGDGLTWRGGLRGVEDYKVTAQGTPNMTVNVAAGMAFVRGTLNAFQGVYAVPNDGTVLLNVSPANPTLARHDLVIIRVNDAFYSGATNNAAIEIVTGTASATPADPTVPSNSLVLARITVGAGVTSIGQGVIADLRTWTASMGGAIPVNGFAGLPATAVKGQIAMDFNTGGTYVYDGTNWYGAVPATPSCRIENISAAFSQVNNVTFNAQFDTIAHDTTGIMADIANNRIVIPRTGYYDISARVSFRQGASVGVGYRRTSVLVGGNSKAYQPLDGSDQSGLHTAPTVQWSGLCTAGQAVTVQGFHSYSAALFIDGNNTYPSFLDVRMVASA